jgi:hypothetical protein
MTEVYNSFLTGLNRAEFDWVLDDYSVWLVDAQYEFDPAHTTRADLGGFELNDVQPLRGRTVDGLEPVGTRLSANNVDWYGLTGSLRYAVICRGQDLVACADLGEQTFTDATVSLNFNDGVYALQPQVTDG